MKGSHSIITVSAVDEFFWCDGLTLALTHCDLVMPYDDIALCYNFVTIINHCTHNVEYNIHLLLVS